MKNTTVRLFHGGKDLPSKLSELMPSRTGRAEFGAGLYLTNNVERAMSYAKGSRRLYEVEVDLSQAQSLRDAYLPFERIHEWAKEHLSAPRRTQLMADIERRNENGYVSANVVNNLMINLNLLTAKNSLPMNELLRSAHADYLIDSFGGVRDEQVLVVFNPAIMKGATPLSQSKLTESDYAIERISEPSRPRFEVIQYHLERILRQFEEKENQMGALLSDDGYITFMDDEGRLSRYQLNDEGCYGKDIMDTSIAFNKTHWDNSVGKCHEPLDLGFRTLREAIQPMASFEQNESEGFRPEPR